ncbi:MAG TPA: acyl-CoA reductase [Chitinophagaceae bacterium]|jgi:hypothetical protein|nr:acyl-CoA reductase [Chitinophagaceae bacterium]HPH22826.1 acyl-CoA reductase [Chitinophagaceae bacterium]
MILQERIALLENLGKYILSNNENWQQIKERASRENAWFTPNFIEVSTTNVAEQFLQKHLLENWIESYKFTDNPNEVKNIGVVMAGNIPLVGFHDFLCVFISGHKITIKPSSKDEILIKHLVEYLVSLNEECSKQIQFAENLKGCNTYIATGSNNSSRYFDYYFGKYPNIIRRNRTSVAILTGEETDEMLDLLTDDIQMYFGLGCRNVTKLYVPEGYDFIPLLNALKKYDEYFEFHKYKHNYDYHLALLMMSNKLYMTNGSVILSENEALFSPISQVNYSHYNHVESLISSLKSTSDVQCIVGKYGVPFGKAQQPKLNDYADGIDTLQFLLNL